MFLFLDMPTLKLKIIIIIILPTDRPAKVIPTARTTKIKIYYVIKHLMLLKLLNMMDINVELLQ